MQFHVPQFLEVEDKMFGILTLKQFLYLFGGASIAYLAYTYLWKFIAVPIVFASLAFGGALAFAKVNNQPFINIVDAYLRYIFSPKLYIWKKVPKPIEQKKEQEKTGMGVYIPPLSQSKLKDLSWSLDITEHSKSQDDQPDMAHEKKVPLLKDI